MFIQRIVVLFNLLTGQIPPGENATILRDWFFLLCCFNTIILYFYILKGGIDLGMKIASLDIEWPDLMKY